MYQIKKRSNQDIDCINGMAMFNMLGKARKDGKREAVFGKNRICNANVGRFRFFRL